MHPETTRYTEAHVTYCLATGREISREQVAAADLADLGEKPDLSAPQLYVPH